MKKNIKLTLYFTLLMMFRETDIIFIYWLLIHSLPTCF
jgi:hypothetical protein